jgi:nanoRNase/pAp phosphatase (c-di-AMP/oligoRNAs hydrolase)
MRCIFVCPDDFLWRLVADAGEPGLDALYLVETARARTRIAQRGGEVLAGALEGDPLYRRAFRTGTEPVLMAIERSRQARVVAAIRRVAPAAPILALAEDRVPGAEPEGVIPLTMDAVAERFVEPALARALTRVRAERVRAHFARAERVLIMMQDDPDPDAIASALALREVLGRDEKTARILTCGRVTRPENRRLIDELGVRIDHVSARSLAEQEHLILVDVQPTYFNVELTNVAAVIDHHPPTAAFRARFKDVRPTYGAAATIAAEYLLADGDSLLTRELATALLYGIITDTKSLSRSASDDDLEMFAYLFPRADHALLRRIQHPSYAPATLRRFGMALQHTHVRNAVAHAHLGRLPEDQEHVVAQLAEFCLGMEGAEIAVVSGIFHDRVVMSARALWPGAKLGDRLREAFDRYGSAGGHAVMAKAVIHLDEWKRAHRVHGDRGVELSVGRAVHRALARSSRARRTSR